MVSSSGLRTAIVLLISSFALVSTPVLAQQPVQLPGLYVEGATLEGKARAAQPRTQPVAPAAPSAEGEPPASQPEGVGGVPLDMVGSAVTVVTGEQLRAQQVRSAIEALRGLPGVSVSQGGGPGGSPAQVRIRGGESNHTLVLIDGIDAGDTNSNEFDFANLLTEDIERIEILRGPQSGIYGSKAIGGVVNIVTRGGKGPLTASIRAEGGAYGTGDIAARFAGGNDKAWFTLSAQQRGQQYFNPAPIGTEEDPWRAGSAMLKAGVTLAPGLAVDFLLRQTQRRTHYDDWEIPPGGGLARSIDANNRNETDSFLGGVNLRWSMLGGALLHTVSANRNTIESDDFTKWGHDNNYNERNKLSYLGTYRFGTAGAEHSISGLVEQEGEEFKPNNTYSDTSRRERDRFAVAGEYRGVFFDRLVFTGALRHDDNDTFADFTTWRTTASLNLPEYYIRPHASYGTGASLPGMFEQFGAVKDLFKGNPNLQPEESQGWDLGIEFTLIRQRAFLDVTYFHTNLMNEIAPFFYPDGTSTLINLPGESERQGTEIALRAQLFPFLYFGASYTFLDAAEPDGTPEIRRPKNAMRFDTTYTFAGGRGTFNVAAMYNGRMHDLNYGSSSGRVTLNDYWLVSSALTYKLQPGVELFGRVENLLDTKYEEVSGYNAPGVAAFAGVRFTFGGPEGFGGRWADAR